MDDIHDNAPRGKAEIFSPGTTKWTRYQSLFAAQSIETVN
jgi:hypothetical protein